MGDIAAKWRRKHRNFKWIFKRMIYLRDVEEDTDDEMFNRLLYLQAVDEFAVGNLLQESEDDVVELATIAIAQECASEEVEFPLNEAGGREPEQILIEDNFLMDFIPQRVWKEKMAPEEWASRVLTVAPKVRLEGRGCNCIRMSSKLTELLRVRAHG